MEEIQTEGSMMASETTSALTAKQIQTEEGDDYLLIVETGCTKINSDFPPVPLTLCLTDTKKFYIGELTRENIEKSLEKLKIRPELFYSHMFEALINPECTTGYAFVAQHVVKGKNMTFTWKKIHTSDSIKFQLGNVTLEEKETNILSRLLKTQMENLNRNTRTIAESESERNRLENELKSSLNTLENFVEEKEKLEIEMYSKFVHVLNEKKRKIRDLQSYISVMDGKGKDSSNNSCQAGNMPSCSKDDLREKEFEDDYEKSSSPPKRSRRQDRCRKQIPMTTVDVKSKRLHSLSNTQRVEADEDENDETLMDEI